MAVSRGRALRRAARGAAGPIIVAVAVQSAGNLVFHAVVGRLLAPDEYGALGAVLAAMVMLGVPLGALQAAASSLVAQHGEARATTVRVLRAVGLWAVPPACLVLVAAPAVRAYFHLGCTLDAAQLAPYLVVSAVLAAGRGLLLGAHRVAPVAATYLIGSVVRLALGLALVVPLGVSGALLGTVLAEAAALAIALRGLSGQGWHSAARSLQLRCVALAAVAMTGLFLFSTIDLLLARHHLQGQASGEYMAAATVAKTVLALPAGLMSAALPGLVTGWPRAGRGRTLAGVTALVVGPALLAAAVLVTVPGLVLGLLYGHAYAQATGLVRVLAGVAALSSLVTVLTNAALARSAVSLVLPWTGAVLETTLIELWHGSVGQVAAGSAAALVPTVLLLLAVEVPAWRRPPRPP